jgi:dTMP kinase
VSGRLITLEGGEGAGKSSAMHTLEATLREAGVDFIRTREPGGTEIGEAIRSLLLDPAHRGLCAETELLLMFASRAQLVRERIGPALQSGLWVISDRFTDASFAYQGGGRGIDGGRIAELERWAAGIRPDLTLLLDLDVAQGHARIQDRGEPDRIESEQGDFFSRVRAAYRARAAAEPERVVVIDAGAPIEAVQASLRETLLAFIQRVRG